MATILGERMKPWPWWKQSALPGSLSSTFSGSWQHPRNGHSSREVLTSSTSLPFSPTTSPCSWWSQSWEVTDTRISRESFKYSESCGCSEFSNYRDIPRDSKVSASQFAIPIKNSDCCSCLWPWGSSYSRASATSQSVRLRTLSSPAFPRPSGGRPSA